ncbi:MAG: glycosyltransferase family 2 protein, partial [Betaproteobacteria bacterium]
GLDIHSLLYMAAATVLGAQMVQLALLTQWMGVLSGVVPPRPWLRRWVPLLSVENGLVLGATLSLLGLAWSVNLVLEWRSAGFGAMDPVVTMRGAIPSITLMILGVQAATAALFAGALHYCWLSPKRSTLS